MRHNVRRVNRLINGKGRLVSICIHCEILKNGSDVPFYGLLQKLSDANVMLNNWGVALDSAQEPKDECIC